ncbi:MAG: hypothetical protein D6820_18175 [Lentisphaerae bacterium]|nr:MAG: hypothetical protein D6820_18175 [Lentisphaerota bacterium]
MEGVGQVTDCRNLSAPALEAVCECQRQTLADAGLGPELIDYVNAHATGTLEGDRVEAEAIAEVFGRDVMVSSLKGLLGHTMAASGTLELMGCLACLHDQMVWPSYNFEERDENLPALRLIRERNDAIVRHVMKNSFAFGGVNVSVIIGKDF